MNISVNPDDVCCDLAEEGAALGLLGLMTGISEEFWCAGWMSDLEYDLWQVPAGKKYGHGEITERQSTLLRLLSDECDGWWHWDEEGGAVFIRREEWLKKLAKLKG